LLFFLVFIQDNYSFVGSSIHLIYTNCDFVLQQQNSLALHIFFRLSPVTQ